MEAELWQDWGKQSSKKSWRRAREWHTVSKLMEYTEDPSDPNDIREVKEEGTEGDTHGLLVTEGMAGCYTGGTKRNMAEADPRRPTRSLIGEWPLSMWE